MPSDSPPHGIFELETSRSLGLTTTLFYAGLVGLLLLVILAAISYWRHKNKKTPAVPPPANPWDQLSTLLQESAHMPSAMLSMGMLNHSLRKGLELRTGEAYTAWTSAEIVAHLQKKSAFSSDFQAECAEFLKTADRVLFAFQPYQDGERERWEKDIRQWLEALREGRPL